VYLRATATGVFPALTFVLLGLLASPANAGTITLISAPTGDHGERVCTVDIPAAGAGTTIRLSLADKGGVGKGNCYDMQPTEVTMKDIPSAAEILLTDDWLCNTTMGTRNYQHDDPADNKNFFIRLATVRNPSQLPQIGIDRLTQFNDGEPIWAEDYPASGFRMVESKYNGAKRVTRRLSCLEITISEDDKTPTLQPVALGDTEEVEVAEESYSYAECTTGHVMTWRKHKGDENAKTTYGCAKVTGKPTEKIIQGPQFVSDKFPECGRRKPGSESKEPPDKNCKDAVNYDKDEVDYTYFTCPPDHAMLMREHGDADHNDENSDTQYGCNEFYVNIQVPENRIVIKPGEWEQEQKESDSSHQCGPDRVIIGRAHHGDENGPSVIRCGTLYYPTHPKPVVTP